MNHINYDAGFERERLAAELAEEMHNGLSTDRMARFRQDLARLREATEIPAKELYEMLRADARRMILEEIDR